MTNQHIGRIVNNRSKRISIADLFSEQKPHSEMVNGFHVCIVKLPGNRWGGTYRSKYLTIAVHVFCDKYSQVIPAIKARMALLGDV